MKDKDKHKRSFFPSVLQQKSFTTGISNSTVIDVFTVQIRLS